MNELEKFTVLVRAGALPHHVKRRAFQRKRHAERLERIRERALARCLRAAREVC